ncbi:uncharacterized protein [Zea mays]|uniref:uncharacterized protein isoform X3 n=1 Tax=Zea mays TaxID=4577 RepID=UPI0004DEB5CE|nr:uncharacterized protein LOC103635082 isoform X3 [Zea mays]|eukprot:XP_008655856.1 uncharacterized protein LOC103635082 isoform X3 [Zea mays]
MHDVFRGIGHQEPSYPRQIADRWSAAPEKASSGAKAKQPTTIRGTNREQRSSRIESARKKKKKKMKMKMIMIMEQEEEACSSYCSSPLRQCRICYDEEDERRSAMESPCACSGSLKYAHRGCVQRWCDEKGSTVCEICLQNFETGYTVPPKKTQPADVAVTISRDSVAVPRQQNEPEDEEEQVAAALIGASDPEYAECARAAGRSASCCRSVAVTFTIVLLLRHLVTVVTLGAANQQQFAFSLLTVYMLRASGILLPFYVAMRLICVIQQGQRQYRLHLLQEQRRHALRRLVWLQGQGQHQQPHVILVR